MILWRQNKGHKSKKRDVIRIQDGLLKNENRNLINSAAIVSV
jgi:hypothetical protein